MIPGGRVSPSGNQDLQPPEICRSYKHNHLLPSFPLPLDSWTHEFYLLGIQPFIMVIILGCILDPRRWHLSFVILLFNHAGEFWVEWYRIMVMCPQHASLAVKWISWSLVLLCRILCWQMKHSGSPWTVVLGRKMETCDMCPFQSRGSTDPCRMGGVQCNHLTSNWLVDPTLWGIQHCSCWQSVRHSAVAVTRLALVSKNIDYLLYFFLLTNQLWGLFILVLFFSVC